MTKTILRIDCSPKASAAHSSRFADELTNKLWMERPDMPVVHRVLAEHPPALVDSGFALAMMTHQSAESAAEHEALQTSEVLIRELENAAVLVLSTPMHNFTVPAVLKAWIDQIVRFGRTFQSTPKGKIGLLADRPTYIVIASGSYFAGKRARQPDHLTPYLRDILATIGITELHFILLEGLALGDLAVEEAQRLALDQIRAKPARHQ